MSGRLSRKQLLAAAAGSAAVGAAGYALMGREEAATPAGLANEPFYGAHQAGITTPQQKYLRFAALDLDVKERADLAALLRKLTEGAAKLASGEGTSARLTVTFGFGPSMLTAASA